MQDKVPSKGGAGAYLFLHQKWNFQVICQWEGRYGTHEHPHNFQDACVCYSFFPSHSWIHLKLDFNQPTTIISAQHVSDMEVFMEQVVQSPTNISNLEAIEKCPNDTTD